MKKFLTMALVVLTLGLGSCTGHRSTEVVEEIDSTEVVVDTVNVDSVPVVDTVVDSTGVN